MDSIGALCLVVAAGLLGPALSGATRGRLPVVAGQILAGMMLGPHALGLLDPADPVLRVLHDAGFALLMFDVGMHLPLRDPALRSGLRRGLLAAAACLPLSAAAAWGIGRAVGIYAHWPALALALAISSAAVALPMLRDAGGYSGARAPLAVWLLSADILTVLLLPLASHEGSLLRVVGASVAVSLTAAAVTFTLARAERVPAWASLRQQSKRGKWGFDLRVALLIVFGLTWMAVSLGASPLVAGFAAGVAVSAGGHTPKRFTQQIVGVGDGFLIPVFFVVLGMGLDASALRSGRGALLAGLVVAGTVLVHSLAARAAGMGRGAGLVASAQMGVPAAMVALGLRAGWLDGGQGAAIMAAALVSVLVCAAGVASLRRAEATD